MATKKTKRRSKSRRATASPPGLSLDATIELRALGRHIRWTPQADLVAVVTSTGLRMMRGNDWTIAAVLGDVSTSTIAFSPNGELLAHTFMQELLVKRTANNKTVLRKHIGVSLGRVAWSPDGAWLSVGTLDGGPLIIEAQGGELAATLDHDASVYSSSWSPAGNLLATAGYDGVLKIWNARTWTLRNEARFPQNEIHEVTWSPDGRLLAIGLTDRTGRILLAEDLQTMAVIEGHTSIPYYFEFSRDGQLLLSSAPNEHRLWNTRGWALVAELPADISFTTFDPNGNRLMTISDDRLQLWGYDLETLFQSSDATGGRYVNAKIVLVGDTGVGKSGLGLVLSGRKWTPTDSTHGRHVWLFGTEKVQLETGEIETRETLLWDLAGQPDYRLVHQLHLTEVVTALVVFDSRSQTDPLAGVKYWNRALRQATQAQTDAPVAMKKYLVAARSDVGRVGMSAGRIARLVDEFRFDGFFETSAKDGWGIAELKTAISESIDWNALPIVSSNRVFEEIKQFLLDEKTSGRLLSTADDLYRAYSIKHRSDDLSAEFGTCIGRLESRGLIQRLSFGNLVLLQPEIRDAYASAMVSAAKDEPDGLGSIREDNARTGNFRIPKERRLSDESLEKLLLISTVEDLIKHEIALREHGEDGAYLVFPSQLTRENPALPDAEGKSAVISFIGPVANIYATLTVRLSHSGLFQRKELWKNAATYTTMRGGTYGISLIEFGEGAGELTLFHDGASADLTMQFEQYVLTHLRRRAISDSISIQRIYTCPSCKTALADSAVEKRRAAGFLWMNCNVCEPPVKIALESVMEPAIVQPSPKLAEMDRAADDQRNRETAASIIEGKRQTNDFDVFLCHNNADKSAVREIGKQLLERGILPWLDEWEISPFVPWQDELEKVIPSIRSVAVFIGPSSERGPWQEMEMRAFLQEFAKRGVRIGLVLLPGALQVEKLPLFLMPFNWVDFNKKEPEPFTQLLWGITGERPSAFAV